MNLVEQLREVAATEPDRYTTGWLKKAADRIAELEARTPAATPINCECGKCEWRDYFTGPVPTHHICAGCGFKVARTHAATIDTPEFQKRFAYMLREEYAELVAYIDSQRTPSLVVGNQTKTLQFLTDVVTAAGLLSHGKTDKGLAKRISDEAYDLRAALFAASTPAAPVVAEGLTRYDPALESKRWDQYEAIMEASVSGDYVKFADIAHLLAAHPVAGSPAEAEPYGWVVSSPRGTEFVRGEGNPWIPSAGAFPVYRHPAPPLQESEGPSVIGKLLDTFSEIEHLWGLNEPGALVRHRDVFNMIVKIGKEQVQRERMQEKFANRASTSATADFDLPAPNDPAEPMPASEAASQQTDQAHVMPPFAAPASQHEAAGVAIMPEQQASGAVYGIIDPDYGRIYTMVRKLAWEEGYAIGLHGSFTRDLDLIAVPWEGGRRCNPSKLVARILQATGMREAHGNPGEKPHGRLVWTLLLPEFGDPRFVDLSIMPVAAESSNAAGSAKGGITNDSTTNLTAPAAPTDAKADEQSVRAAFEVWLSANPQYAQCHVTALSAWMESSRQTYTSAQSVRDALEQAARICADADKSTHPSELADRIRALIQSPQPGEA